MFATEPVTKLSMAMTRCPRASRQSTMCDPRNPAPPVTTDVGCWTEPRRVVRFGMARIYWVIGSGATAGVRIADCELRIADCGLQVAVEQSCKWRVSREAG